MQPSKFPPAIGRCIPTTQTQMKENDHIPLIDKYTGISSLLLYFITILYTLDSRNVLNDEQINC